MKFTKEDGIITAAKAQARSAAGQEDSIIREAVRRAMDNIKRSSTYGYRTTTLWTNLNEFPQEATNILQSLGYRVTETIDHRGSNLKPMRFYTITW